MPTNPLDVLLERDPYLAPHRSELERRAAHTRAIRSQIAGTGSLRDFAAGHEHFGLHRIGDCWVFREWAPSAESIFLIGDFSGWQPEEKFRLSRASAAGEWCLELGKGCLQHGDLYRLLVRWQGGEGDRIPAYARRVVQDPHTHLFNAQVWDPDTPFKPQHRSPPRPQFPQIYEAHVGMAQEREGVGSFEEFRTATLPRIADAGYNTLQLMAIQEHPYYGSFGYHVSSFFAPSSRFGTPDEFARLVDDAHAVGICVIIDLVHSHSVINEVEGLSRFDGTRHQYFHEGGRGEHPAWGSLCFDYGKIPVIHFLLSNCRYWIEEMNIDGFRFDGITSMLYHHHGLGTHFAGYGDYFGDDVDRDALTYLALANEVIHEIRPDALTIAEDVSGMPGLTAPADAGGAGFDARLAMGVPDHWFELVSRERDENWLMTRIWHELTNRRPEEVTIGYTESHDQALVGGKTLAFELIDADMYDHMTRGDANLRVERGMALHKMLRLATSTTAHGGYLNFMGNEFGHPEWIDFPREGNNWSYHYARRRWSLRDDRLLKYFCLAEFDNALQHLLSGAHLSPSSPACLLVARNDEQLLAFERCGLLVFLNFNPTRSFSDCAFEVPSGDYSLVLDTDEERFDGQARIAHPQRFTTRPEISNNTLKQTIRLYLPARTGLLLARSS